MTTIDERELHRQVRAADLELATLTEEEYRALWAPEEVELDPSTAPVMEAALRSLVARGLASVEPDGRVALGGLTTFVRSARMANLGTVTVQLAPGSGPKLLVWFLVQPDVLLELAWGTAGICDVRLRRTGRAVRELSATLVPARDEPTAAADGGAWEWVEDDAESTARLEELLASHPQVTGIQVVRPVVEDDVHVGWVTYDAMIAAAVAAPDAWLVLSQGDGRSTVALARRSAVRELLLGATGVPTSVQDGSGAAQEGIPLLDAEPETT